MLMSSIITVEILPLLEAVKVKICAQCLEVPGEAHAVCLSICHKCLVRASRNARGALAGMQVPVAVAMFDLGEAGNFERRSVPSQRSSCCSSKIKWLPEISMLSF
jgi:hypothetical protein